MSDRRLLVRPAAVAGSFYPGDRSSLERALQESFRDAVAPAEDAAAPKAIVVPHAGYVYSGAVAASGYLRLARLLDRIERVVLIGPSHRVPLRGIAVPSVDAFSTPLGLVPIDADAREAALAAGPVVTVDDLPHAREHSLEVQVPFLQTVLDDFSMLPLAVGHAPAHDVAAVLDAVWGGPETVVVVSTDLSHYERYDVACARDARTARAITSLVPGDVGDVDACGAYGLRGLLVAAARRHMRVDQIALCNSGDTAGDRSRVVGYGAFAVV